MKAIKYTLLFIFIYISFFSFSQWNEIKKFPAKGYFLFMQFTSSDTGYIFIDTLNGLPDNHHYNLIKTTDGGQNFIPINMPIKESKKNHFIDAKFFSNDSGVIITLKQYFFEGTYKDSVFLYQTYDGGTNWSKKLVYTWNGAIYYDFRINMSLLDVNNGFFAFTQVGLNRDSVIFIKFQNNSFYTYNNYLSNYTSLANLKFFDQNIGVASGYYNTKTEKGGYLIRTFNGGLNWENIYKFSLDYNSSSFIPIDSNNIYIVYDSIYLITKFLRSSDLGKTWSVVYRDNFKEIFPVSYCFSNSDTGFILGYDDKKYFLYKTIDAGLTWKYLAFGDTMIEKIHFINDSVGFMLAIYTDNSYKKWYSILKTTNSGYVSRNDISRINSTFKVFPNPFKNEIIIENLDKNFTEYCITIFNQTGQKIFYQNKIKDSKYLLHTEKLKQGVYLLKIHSGKDFFTTKIIKIENE